MRLRPRDTAFRVMHLIHKGTLVKADDSKKLQEVQITGTFGETIKGIENYALNYGYTFVPLPPDQQDKKKAAELIVANIESNRDHPVIIGISDRRSRMRDLQPGEVGVHDDQHQRLHITRDGVDLATPKKSVTRTVKQGSGSGGGGGTGGSGGGSSTDKASTKDTRQQEKSKTSITQDPDAGTIVFSANDDNGTPQSSITLKSDGTVEIKGKKFSFEASEESVTKAPSVYLGDKTGAKLVIRKDDVDSGGDTQIPTTTKVYIA